MFATFKPSFAVILCFVISACSSIPLTTLLKFSSYDEQELLKLKPKQIRAKLTVNSFLNIDLVNTKLGVTIKSNNGDLALEFPLKQMSLSQTPAKISFFSSTPASQTYLLKLSDKAIADFIALQQQLTLSEKNTFGLSVAAKLERNENLSPEQKAQRLFMTIELKLSEQQDFFTLIDNAEISDMSSSN